MTCHIYNKKSSQWQSIHENTMSKWDDFMKFDEEMSKWYFDSM